MTAFPYGYPTAYSRPFAGGYHWPRCINSEPGTFGHECGKPATCIGTHYPSGTDAALCDDCAMNGTEGRQHVNLRPIGLAPVAVGSWVRVLDADNWYRGRTARVLLVSQLGPQPTPIALCEIKTENGSITFAAGTDQLRVTA